jgi:sec-independent protein translocase protein TatC
MFAGITAASPFVLYQLWAFIAPGLTPRERRMALPVLPVVLALFICGVAFIWFGLLPLTLKFLIGMAPSQLQPTLSQEHYFGFITALCLAGGLLFELPCVLGLLGYLGVVDAKFLWRYVGHALVVLMFIAAVITPTGDAFTMLAMTAPMMALYLLSIGVVALIRRPRQD